MAYPDDTDAAMIARVLDWVPKLEGWAIEAETVCGTRKP